MHSQPILVYMMLFHQTAHLPQCTVHGHSKIDIDNMGEHVNSRNTRQGHRTCGKEGTGGLHQTCVDELSAVT